MRGWGEAIDVLVRQRGPALLRYGYLLTGSTADAQDLVQEALARVLARRPRLRAAVTLESYVRRTMATLVVDDGRRAQRWRQVRHLLAAPDEVPDGASVADDRQTLVAALATLSPRQRACVVLHHLDGLSGPEVADVLGIAPGSVKRYLSEGMERLERVVGPVAETTDVVATRGRGGR
ncbi:SigE family RNA polymerase sigma factor [Cellulomonas fimi]|uniref:RNA polymerase, sigma-24 subunit, ECF subfamily n=1 Tax=Cellulomonas fimi (strain ATCC 484 / DSM 20113 / JCM 1341 / CCUG 24087 / LMG 16345 / NBRC 15513 / NCIMB 8980 / NCTC 7547 / NRS-133) TaxID=590998 RepID=F4H329_CELFA|nr:SigE family RNA polymerase sigma factor [Cellulomonas fimi]AEE47647.1 RNA polymerase, sigma-24 subunit, ECF subfamily [Cellulomonas fimi ATCC 484]NNH09030.1 SigE family RNA polymerase sigma factor [Cellulomonas fimi]VEH36716.1 RNA polymerase sigma-E factor [Cellulomonas fimi]